MKSEKTKSVFETLNAININELRKEKGKMSYLAWAYAWAEVKKLHPDMTSTVYENADGLNYHHDGKTAWVKTGITIGGMEHIEYLPILSNNNSSIPLANITSWNVNNSIQRSLTKAIARHGLGLYLYSGEDYPEEEVVANNAAEIERAAKDVEDQTLINQYVHSLKKALGGETLDDSGVREVFAEIAKDENRLKSRVYKLLLPEEQSMITEVMTKTTKEAA
tara:strand:+ start:168 stop:830 length:663 start_codon:yes stop_codon:yes gene_type:complete